MYTDMRKIQYNQGKIKYINFRKNEFLIYKIYHLTIDLVVRYFQRT